MENNSVITVVDVFAKSHFFTVWGNDQNPSNYNKNKNPHNTTARGSSPQVL